MPTDTYYRPDYLDLTVADRHLSHYAEVDAKLDDWFTREDKDGNGLLDEKEVAALLTHVDPAMPPPSSELVAQLMQKARGTDQGEAIGRDAVTKVVRQYAAFAGQQKAIEDLFSRFDADGSGYFDERELREVMKELAPDGVVTDADVTFVWEQCDPDNDGKITRDELMPLVATWKKVSVQNQRRRKDAEGEVEEAPTTQQTPQSKTKSSTCALL